MTYLISDFDLALQAIFWLLVGGFAGGVVVAICYELKYRKGISWQREFDRDLFK